MNQIAKETIHADLEMEMRQSYLDYAMSVIVGRALPDVRDGLKPVHRRVLYAMSVLGNDWNKAYKKSARIVGDVIGKYHPHGDTAVYDTIVRMAQNFSMRYPLVDGQGNFGSIDGDSPAAMRYTEIRLAKIAHELLADLEKETVDFGLNYDETETQPLVLPTRIPNLLVNGSSGIAVGMATNIPPHNLNEVTSACIALLDNENLTTDELMNFIPGPDFPTYGILSGQSGIREAYRTGRGKAYIRARTNFEDLDKGSRQSIIVTELPYQVNKARLLEKIAELVKNKKIEGISAMRDESDKSGMRVVVELRRGEVPEVVLNNLYKQTQMQTVFGINMVALINNQPRLFNLKEMLEEFLRHRREVVTRRAIFDLRKARERGHVLEGLAVALSNIDEIIELIKKSSNPAEAKQGLMAKDWLAGAVLPMLERTGTDITRPQWVEAEYGLHSDKYKLTESQAQAILDLRLHRLTGLEQDKIHKEYEDIVETIKDLLDILENPQRLITVVREELEEVKAKYGDERRTEITHSQHDMSAEDFIVDEEVLVTLSHTGYAKSQPLDEYRAQRRGGRGKAATAMKDEDFINRMFVASMHDTMLCFSNHGQVYWLKVYQFPQAGRASRGKPLVNLLPLDEGEEVTAVLPIREYSEDLFILMSTKHGIIKKSKLTDFSRPRSSGIRAVALDEGDQLIDVAVTDAKHHVLIFSNLGKAVRFHESAIRVVGRTARGVKAINLSDGDVVVNMKVTQEDDVESSVMVATINGYGKRTSITEYPLRSRGTKGVISIQTSDRNGEVVSADLVQEMDEVMLITNGGVLIRTRVNEVSQIGRNTQGVRLINLDKNEQLISLNRIAEVSEDDTPQDGEIDDSDDGHNDQGDSDSDSPSTVH